MENKNLIAKIFAFLAFSLVVVNAVFAFGNAGSTSFIQVFLIVALIAIFIASFVLCKNTQEVAPVIGASLLYFGHIAIRSFIYLLDQTVNFIRELSYNNLRDKINYGGLNSEEITKLNNKISALSKRMAKDTFGEILDVLCLIIAVMVIAFVAFTFIEYLVKKDFEKTLVGKITTKLVKGDKKESTQKEVVEEEAK